MPRLRPIPEPNAPDVCIAGRRAAERLFEFVESWGAFPPNRNWPQLIRKPSPRSRPKIDCHVSLSPPRAGLAK